LKEFLRTSQFIGNYVLEKNLIKPRIWSGRRTILLGQ
jgi:hypothetical protein